LLSVAGLPCDLTSTLHLILVQHGRRFPVVAVVPFDEEDESPFVGLLQVEEM